MLVVWVEQISLLKGSTSLTSTPSKKATSVPSSFWAFTFPVMVTLLLASAGKVGQSEGAGVWVGVAVGVFVDVGVTVGVRVGVDVAMGVRVGVAGTVAVGAAVVCVGVVEGGPMAILTLMLPELSDKRLSLIPRYRYPDWPICC